MKRVDVTLITNIESITIVTEILLSVSNSKKKNPYFNSKNYFRNMTKKKINIKLQHYQKNNCRAPQVFILKINEIYCFTYFFPLTNFTPEMCIQLISTIFKLFLFLIYKSNKFRFN